MFRRTRVQPTYLCALLLVAVTGMAQTLPETLPPTGDFGPDPQPGAVLQKVPADVILVKGAVPSASDHSVPLPEEGGVVKGVYKNRYFGMSWTLPDDWSEPFGGPPPSESGGYVLSNVVPAPKFKGPSKGTVLISAQDMFFAPMPADDAKELIAYRREHLEPYYDVERAPAELTIAGRPFSRFDYESKVAGIHWAVLATTVRCHAVQFVFSSRDPKLIESLVKDLDAMKFDDAGWPRCVADYVTRANVIERVDPVLKDRRFNAIPARLVVDKKGRVKHVHILSAFPEQAQLITDALLQWRFKPYLVNGEPVEIETGVTFNAPPRNRKTTAPPVSTASD